MYLKIRSAEVVCCMQMLTSSTNFGIYTHSVDPDRTVSREEVGSGSILFATETIKWTSRCQKQSTYIHEITPPCYDILL